MHYLVYLLIIVWICSTAVSKLPHEKFEAASGDSCMWFPLKTNVNEITLSVVCWCDSESGRKKHYGCSYSTSEHECNKDSQKYFQNIVNTLKGNQTRHSQVLPDLKMNYYQFSIFFS